MNIITYLIDHYDEICIVVTLILTVFKITRWGKANSAALDAIIEVIENRGDKMIKDDVRDLDLKTDARKAIERKVEKHQS